MNKNIIAILALLLGLQSAEAGTATWNLNPASNDWNTAFNWTPSRVPNSPQDTAIFRTSNVTDIVVQSESRNVLDGVIFKPGASPFTISLGSPLNFGMVQIVGTGIINNSGTTQNFVVTGLFDSVLSFLGSATAGSQTLVTNIAPGATSFFGTSNAGSAVFVNVFGQTDFFESSTAAGGTFTNQSDGGSYNGQSSGSIAFWDDSTAANGYFDNKAQNTFGGNIVFGDSATAGTATFINERNDGRGAGASMRFGDTSSADHGTFIVEGGAPVFFSYAHIDFYTSSTADEATFTLEGALQDATPGGTVIFHDTTTAGNSTLIAENGPALFTGGSISFQGDSDGGTTRIQTIGGAGSGTLSIESHNTPGVSIGSLEGSGLALLGGNRLTVGTNNLSTTFSGSITDGLSGNVGGSLTKVGAGRLTLSGANSYTGDTIVTQGTLVIANRVGSGTGTGAVAVSAGTLGGNGVTSGAVTIGTGSGPGAFLAPAASGKVPVTFTISGPLTFDSDATYTCSLRANIGGSQSDTVVANGVTISGAKFALRPKISGTLQAGTVFTVLNNTSATSISGTFANLPNDGTITVGVNTYLANYEGGDGNDLTLTVL